MAATKAPTKAPAKMRQYGKSIEQSKCRVDFGGQDSVHNWLDW